MKYSFIITAWKEPISVAEIFEKVLNPKYKNLLPEMEIILACPDEETHESALNVVKKYDFKDFIFIQDPHKGKPFALSLAFKQARGEILILTDGDVVIDDSALTNLVKPFDDPKVGGVTGHPVSADSRKNLLGYYGHLLADAAHHKRTKEFGNGGYYFMSGYLLAIRNYKFELPEEILVDDAWLTNKLIETENKIAYAHDAKVFVKYPKSFSDWYKQKTRSVGGYSQLQKGVKTKQKRRLIDELKYFLFPFKHAKNPREYGYLFVIYPARLLLWFRIWRYRTVSKKNFNKLWVRIESTK